MLYYNTIITAHDTDTSCSDIPFEWLIYNYDIGMAALMPSCLIGGHFDPVLLISFKNIASNIIITSLANSIAVIIMNYKITISK